MNSAELEALVPGSHVFELKPGSRYLIVLSSDYIPMRTVDALLNDVSMVGVEACILLVRNVQEAIKVFEMEPSDAS
jgi:hypothetical protein